jgi:hypothetical protein
MGGVALREVPTLFGQSRECRHSKQQQNNRHPVHHTHPAPRTSRPKTRRPESIHLRQTRSSWCQTQQDNAIVRFPPPGSKKGQARRVQSRPPSGTGTLAGALRTSSED